MRRLRPEAKDNGAPGPRDFAPTYYAAFVIDLDGNNIEAASRGLKRLRAALSRSRTGLGDQRPRAVQGGELNGARPCGSSAAAAAMVAPP